MDTGTAQALGHAKVSGGFLCFLPPNPVAFVIRHHATGCPHPHFTPSDIQGARHRGSWRREASSCTPSWAGPPHTGGTAIGGHAHTRASSCPVRWGIVGAQFSMCDPVPLGSHLLGSQFPRHRQGRTEQRLITQAILPLVQEPGAPLADPAGAENPPVCLISLLLCNLSF